MIYFGSLTKIYFILNNYFRWIKDNYDGGITDNWSSFFSGNIWFFGGCINNNSFSASTNKDT